MSTGALLLIFGNGAGWLMLTEGFNRKRRDELRDNMMTAIMLLFC